MTKSNRGFYQQSRGRNSKINDPIWPVCELVQDFIHVYLICKLQEAQMKNEQVVLMTVKQAFSAIMGT